MENTHNITLRKLYGQLLEMEGLVLLAMTRGDDTPADVYQNLHDKAQSAAKSLASILPSDSEPSSSPVKNDDAKEAGRQIAESATTEEEAEADVTPAAVEEEFHASSLFELPDDLLDGDENPFESPAPKAEEVVPASSEEPKPAVKEQPAPPAVNPMDSASYEPLFPESATDRLKRMFTINDRYRFRRELFSNNDSDMADAINIFAAMRTYAEAQDYIVNDLGWDMEVPEVTDFMKILEAFFRKA